LLAPIFKQVKDELGETLKIVKIYVDKNSAIALKFNLRSVYHHVIVQKRQAALATIRSSTKE